MLLEVIRQVTLIDETRHRRHHRWNGAIGEKLPSSLDAYLNEVLVRRQPGCVAECANDVKGCHPCALREHLQRSLVAPGVGILQHLSYDTHDAWLALNREAPIKAALRAPARVSPDQFGDRYAGGFLSGVFMSGGFMATAGRSRVGTNVSMAESIGRADCAIECLIRAQYHRVTQDQGAELRWFSIGAACSFCVQNRQLDGKIDGEIREGFHTRAHASRVYFARRNHNDISLGRKTLSSATPKRASSAKNQTERISVVAMPREGLRLVRGTQHLDRLTKSRPYSCNPSLIQREASRRDPSLHRRVRSPCLLAQVAPIG